MSQKNSYIILLILVCFGVSLRVTSINVPLMDKNAWRQTDTAAVAKNFYENGFKILYPQVNWGGASTGYAESEFQIYPFLVAILYKFFGFHDWLGRLVSLTFFGIGTILLFKLTQKKFESKIAIWTTVFFMISPLNIHFSRAFMPTSMLVCCSIASIYYFSEWIDKNKWPLFLLSALATALSVIIKPPSLYLGLPLLYLAMGRYGKRVFCMWQMWGFAVLVFAPSILWYHHAHQIFLETHLTFGLWGEGYSKFGNITYWLNIDFYKTIASRLLKDILPVGGIVFVLIGCLIKTEKGAAVVFWWLLAFAVYILLVAEGHQTHLYYQMPLVPILCIFAGSGMNYLWEKGLSREGFLKKRIFVKSMIIVIVILMAVAGVLRQREYLVFKADRLAYGRRIGELTEEGSLIIFGGWNKGRHLQVKYPPRDPIDFYFSNRKGWEINLDNWSFDLVERLRHQGAKYFATFWPNGLDMKTEFEKDIRENYTLLEATDRWVIYKLN